MNQSDPTDHALAAIASILDQPEPVRESEKAAVEEKPVTPENVEADGYSKMGPGPMEAIRFKWIVRREDDGHYFVDDRESEARQRFERLRSEMTGRAAAANVVRKDGGEM